MGTNVQIVMSPVRKLALVGRPRNRSVSSALASDRSSSTGPWRPVAAAVSRFCAPPVRSTGDVVERAPDLFVLPGFVRGRRRQPCRPPGQGIGPSLRRLWPGQLVEGNPQAVDQLGHAAGQVDVVTGEVTKGEHPSKQPLVLRHGHSEQEPVDAGSPRTGFDAVQFPGFAVRAVEAPTDARPGQPTLDPGKSLLAGVQAEAPGHRFSRDAKSSTSEAVTLLPASSSRWAATASIGLVCLSERSASRARQRGRPGQDGGPKGGVDQGSEQLDVGAHHDHVPGLERRVVRQ